MGTDGAHPQSTHSFGYWVRRRRLALDLTQAALARRVACSPSTIKKIERDERRPSRTTAERLAECLEIELPERDAFIATALAERAPHRLELTTEPLVADAARPPLMAQDAPDLDLLGGLARAADPEGIAFVGRTHELRELEDWWHRASGDVAIVSGEPGVGKTRLVAEFSRAVADECVVLYGRADEGAGSSYEPVLGALRQFVLTAAEEDLDALSPTACAALFRLVPEMAERRPEAAALAAAWTEIDRSWLLGAVADAFANQRRPILLVVDDLHWAEKPALLLLERLAMTQPRVRLLGTCRDPVGAPGIPLADFLVQLRRHAVPVHRIGLEGLTSDDIIEVVTVLGGGTLTPAAGGFAADLHRRTSGNPFFVREVVRHLEGTGAIAPAQGRWVSGQRLTELGIPGGVHDVVEQRLAGLGPQAVEVLGAGAIVGPEFDVDVLATMLQRDDGEVIEALEAAVRAGVAREDPQRADRYAFVHALVREVLLATIGLSRRIRLEWRAGEALQSLRLSTAYEHAAALARHFAEGLAVGDAGKAVRWALRAGEVAMRAFAYEEAVDHYERALRGLNRSASPADADRVDLLLALGRATDAAGVPDRRREACVEAAELARRMDDPERLAHAAITLLGPLGPGTVDDAVAGLLEEAAQALRGTLELPGRRALLAELLARLSGYLSDGRPDRAAALRDEALALARVAGDERTLALALMFSTAGFALGRDEQQCRLAEATALAGELGDAGVALDAHSRVMAGALTWADRDAFDRHLAEYAKVAATTQSPLHLLLSAVDHAGASAIDGRYADAVEQTRAAQREADSFDDPNLVGNVRFTALTAARELGRLAGYEARFRDTVDEGHGPLKQALLAQTLCAAGKHEEAEARLETAVDDPAVLHGGELRRVTLALLSEVAAALGNARAAARLMSWLEDERHRGDCVIVGPNAFFGALRRYLGLLALVLDRPGETVAHHEAALAVHERMRAPGWAARSRYDLARALAARGGEDDRRQAGHLLQQVRQVAQELGMVALVKEAEEARGLTGEG